MELETLFQLMDRFSRSDLSALEWRQGEDAVVLKREMTAAPAAVPARAGVGAFLECSSG